MSQKKSKTKFLNRALDRGPRNIRIKKEYGQHFLRTQSVVDTMLDHVTIVPHKTLVFEIGCGDGFLTRSILKTDIKKLWVFEIDPEWANYVKETYPDERLTVFEKDFLSITKEDFILQKQQEHIVSREPVEIVQKNTSQCEDDLCVIEQKNYWTVLANLPYQITFPIFSKFVELRSILTEGVVMVQEEVAQKITAEPGESTTQSLYFSYYFDLKKLIKIPPTAFVPPPKVYSRLLYFSPKKDIKPIINEQEFWKFVKLCFKSRRRTLKNNLIQTHYASKLDELTQAFGEHVLLSRAQEFSLKNFLDFWQVLSNS